MTELFRIKPLEWEWFENERMRGYRAIGVSGALVFQDIGVSVGPNDLWYWMPKEGGTHLCASPEEGKQLAEQHWRDYIAKALVPVEESK